MKDRNDSIFSTPDILFGLLCFTFGLITMWAKMNPELTTLQQQLKESQLRVEIVEKTLLLSR